MKKISPESVITVTLIGFGGVPIPSEIKFGDLPGAAQQETKRLIQALQRSTLLNKLFCRDPLHYVSGRMDHDLEIALDGKCLYRSPPIGRIAEEALSLEQIVESRGQDLGEGSSPTLGG